MVISQQKEPISQRIDTRPYLPRAHSPATYTGSPNTFGTVLGTQIDQEAVHIHNEPSRSARTDQMLIPVRAPDEFKDTRGWA